MKRFLYFPLILLLVILLFTACGPQEIPSTDNSADLPATESVGTGTETLGTDQPDIDKTDAVRKRIRVLKLGLRPAKIESTDPSVAEGEITSDYLTLNGYRTGSATLNLTDYFGFTASISVTVDKEKDSIEYKVNECKDDFIEVGIDFGATGNSTTDDTAAFQKAIDAAKPGDTVYVYPGRYRVSLLVMREGVTLKLYTTMTNAKQGFSEEVKKAFDTNEIAILSGTRILNVENGTAGRKGCGNFSIIGGGFDTNLTNRSTLIFGSAKNVTLENVVFKDIMDNHVIQITGTSDITVKNCIFAGFLCGDNFTREVIQVEPSTPGATGGPIAYGEGEFTYPKNVTITGCYFGKSDEAGAPLIAIGHHSRAGAPNATNFRIIDNVFDECLHAAIRYNNITDTEIRGNTFISTAAYKNATQYEKQAENPSLIKIYHQNGNTSYKAQNDVTVIRATSEEQSGVHGLKIEDNTFILGKGADKKAIYISMEGGSPGANFISNQLRQDTYQGEIYTLNGYRVRQNYASDISVKNNTFRIEGQPAYRTDFVYIKDVYRLEYEGNEVKMAAGVTFSGNGQNVKEAGDSFTVNLAKSSRTVTLTDGAARYVFTATAKGVLTFLYQGEGYLTATTDREGNLTLSPAEGRKIGSVTDRNGTAIGKGGTLSGSETYKIAFVG